MPEFLTNNNKKAVINPAQMNDALYLKRVVFKELASAGIDIESFITKAKNDKSLLDGDFDFNAIIAPIFGLLSSEEIDTAILRCLARCTYDHEKITAETFEKEEAREDYYHLVLECLRINLTPFFRGLVFGSKATAAQVMKALPTTQKSE